MSYLIRLQIMLPTLLLTRLMGVLAESRTRWLKNILIRLFSRVYAVDWNETDARNADDFSNFNEFFCRPLRADVRQFQTHDMQFLSPCDGRLGAAGMIADTMQLVQAKGIDYPLQSLLACEASALHALLGYAYQTIYLAPYDYHRVHMPITAELISYSHVPGRLFSVSPATTSSLPGLFCRNERVICWFQDPQNRPWLLVLVGAMMVGSIATCWHGRFLHRSRKAVAHYPLHQPVRLSQGDEMGQFMMGSTVIMITPQHTACNAQAGRTIKLYQRLS